MYCIFWVGGRFLIKKALQPTEKTFCMSEEEYNTISEGNKKIAHRYIDSLSSGAKKLSVSTINYNIRIIGFALRHIKNDLNSLTVDDIDDFIYAVSHWTREKDGKSIDVADSTKKQYYIGFKRFLYWYGKRNKGKKADYQDLADLIEISGKAKPKNVNDMLTDAEIKQMLLATEKFREHHRNKALIAVLAESGCRLGEVASCRIKDLVEVNKDLYRLTFPEGKTGMRTVILCTSKPYLREYLRHGHPDPTNPESPLWVTKLGHEFRQMGSATVYTVIRMTASAAGINKRVHPHLFRHTAATRLIGSGLSEPRVKNMLGWAPNSNMTATYVHLDDADKVAAVSELNGLVDKTVNAKGLEVGKCPHCWETVPSTSTFCFNCGSPLTNDATQTDNTLIETLTTYFAQNPEAQSSLMKNILNLASK